MAAMNLDHASSEGKRKSKLNHVTWSDILITVIMLIWALMIIIPFYNVIVVSFTTETEYARNPLLLFPHMPTIANYKRLFDSGRLLGGYRNTLALLAIGLPLSMFLTTSFAFGMSRKGYPGRRIIFYFVLFTMMFSGGIIPLYLQMKEMGLTNTLFSVVLANSINTFYMIIMRNFFSNLPESLIESSRLDGAGEWQILFRIILPLSMPVIATIVLFYTVDRWNEWYHPMIFIQRGNMHPLQLILRSIVMDSQIDQFVVDSGSVVMEERNFTMGIKMAAIVCTMLPVMCFFPFLQKHFAKGVMVGAIKS